MLQSILQRILHKIAMVAPGGFRIRPQLHRWRGARIGKRVWISQYVYLDELHPEAISIGDNSTIGLRSSVFTHIYWGPKRDSNNAGKVRIGDNVFIGPHCVILPNVHIGDGVVIRAGSVVSRDVPPGVLWGPPQAEATARVTVPLTPDYSLDEFVKGLRPMRKKKVRKE